jgi:hypothetical protein
MSLISQTQTYTKAGTYTYTIPAGVSTLEFHLWGAGGANGSSGPVKDVQSGSASQTVATGLTQVQTGTNSVQTGTRPVQTGTRQIPIGTEQVQVGTKEEAYVVTVSPPRNSKGGSSKNNGKNSGVRTETRYRTVPVYETRTVFRTVPVYGSEPVFREDPVFGLEPVFSTVSIPTFESRAGGIGGVGAGGGYSSKKIQVSQGDVIAVYVGATGVRNVGGFGLELSAGSAKPLVELAMSGENYIDSFKNSAGTSEDICVAVIDEVSVSSSSINASWTAFRTQWPNRKFYILDPTTGTAGDNITLPTGYTSDANAFGPIKVARDNGNDAVATKWYDLVGAASLATGASVRLSIDSSGSMRRDGISCVKASRELFIRDLGTSNGVNYRGGNAGASNNGGSGGGGGGATVLTLNGNIIAVAAGGGGGGGGGILGKSGDPGSPAVISGIASGVRGQGKFSSPGAATGGGGGGGYYGGSAGSSGATGGAGFGGVSFGTIIQAGSGTEPGGRTVSAYPGRNVGFATFSGAAVLVFTKSFNINVKQTNNWKFIDSAWVKVNGDWKDILNGWVKVDGVWEPLITARSIEGAENPASPVITYTLSANRSNVAEGNAVSFTVSTTGLSSGNLVPYSVSGIDASDLQVGSTSGNFVVGTGETITFVPRENNTTNGLRDLRVILDNTEVSAACTILDTSLSPAYAVAANVSVINEGEAVRFVLGNTYGVAGQTVNYSITGIAASRIALGSLTGSFVVGSSEQATILVNEDKTTTGPTVMTMNLSGFPSSASVTVLDTSLTPSGSVSFESSGNWTVPTGVTSINISIAGGGGGGGGAHSDCGNKTHTGGNGGNGEALTFTRTVTPGAVISFSVGAGGAGGAVNKTGGTGSDTVILGVTARGGSGGIFGTSKGGGASGTGYGGSRTNLISRGLNAGIGGGGGPFKTAGSAGVGGSVLISWGQ